MDKKKMLSRLEELVEIGHMEYYRKYRIKMSIPACTQMADTAFSMYIRAKEPYCSCCGKAEPEIKATCGHLFSRIWTQIRWDEDNAAMQCMGCNMKHEHHPESFRKVMATRLGEKAIGKLWDRRQGKPTKAIERLEIAEKYYTKYKEII